MRGIHFTMKLPSSAGMKRAHMVFEFINIKKAQIDNITVL